MRELITPMGILKDFFDNSTVWKDLGTIIDDWLDAIRDQLENSSGELTYRQLDRLSGNAEALRRFRNVNAYIVDEGESHGN